MKTALSHLEKLILDEYKKLTVGKERYLTESMKRAIVTECMYSVMLARYEIEEERSAHTSPNVYVDAVREVYRRLEL